VSIKDSALVEFPRFRGPATVVARWFEGAFNWVPAGPHPVCARPSRPQPVTVKIDESAAAAEAVAELHQELAPSRQPLPPSLPDRRPRTGGDGSLRDGIRETLRQLR
jgi:hypothetical protein